MELLTKGGSLVFIIPDTYLTLHRHEGLRKRILESYKISYITLFPSKFFPNVNFGYAGLSIIFLKNERPENNHTFPVYKCARDVSDLSLLLTDKKKILKFQCFHTAIFGEILHLLFFFHQKCGFFLQ